MKRSIRKPNWDYGQTCCYFITIVVKNRRRSFGEVIDGQIVLSEAGRIAFDCWVNCPAIHPHVSLGAFVIMPDHMHGIVHFRRVLSREKSGTGKLGKQSRTLGVMINGYKAACTIRIRSFDPSFAWQRNYHDKIIKSERSIREVTKYIAMNPMNWDDGVSESDHNF